DLVSCFVEQYEARYGAGTALRGSGIELTTVRVDGSASGLDLEWRRTAPAKPGSPVSVRKVFYFEIGQTLDTAIYNARDLAARQVVTGPAIIESPGTTAVVGPDQQVEMDEFGNLTLTIPAARPSTEEGRSGQGHQPHGLAPPSTGSHSRSSGIACSPSTRSRRLR